MLHTLSEDFPPRFRPILGRPCSAHRAGGLLPVARAVAIWEAASGLRADPAALRWWELFASVKGLGIWVSSAKEYADGANHDPVLAFTGWWLTNAQDRAILETLGRLA